MISKNDIFISLLQFASEKNLYVYEQAFTKKYVVEAKNFKGFGYSKVSLLTIAKRIDEWKKKHKDENDFNPSTISTILENMYKKKEKKLENNKFGFKFIRNTFSRIQNIFLSFSMKTSIVLSRELVHELKSLIKIDDNELPISEQMFGLMLQRSEKEFINIRKCYQKGKKRLKKKNQKGIARIIKTLHEGEEYVKSFNILIKFALIVQKKGSIKNELIILNYIIQADQMIRPWMGYLEYIKYSNPHILNNSEEIIESGIEIARNSASRIIQDWRDFKIEYDQILIQEKLNQKINIDLEPTYQQKDPVNDNVNLRQQFDGNINHLSFVTATSWGTRNYMEDTHLNSTLHLPDSSVFAVFDGHAGQECSDYLKNIFVPLFKYLVDNLVTLSDLVMWNTCKIFFPVAREIWQETILNNGIPCNAGSAAIACIILGRSLWVMNTGDSRAIMCKNGELIQLSLDAKICDSDQLTKNTKNAQLINSIEKRGGIITYTDCPRINNLINLSRSVEVNPELDCASARPSSVTKTDLSDCDLTKQNFIIVASDGLWDRVSSVEAFEIARGIPSINQRLNTLGIANTLRQRALNKGSEDNLTITIVDLNLY